METERLRLRERTLPLLEDLQHLTLADQMNFFGVTSLEELQREWDLSWKRFGNREMKALKWDLIEKNSGKVVGSCGFHNWYAVHERAEIGYALHEGFRGKGFMQEVLPSILAYGFREMKLNRIEAFIRPDNPKSISLIDWLGFSREGSLRERYAFEGNMVDALVFSLLRSEYLKRDATA